MFVEISFTNRKRNFKLMTAKIVIMTKCEQIVVSAGVASDDIVCHDEVG